ncbi:MAG: sulfoxide reductase heme-binding subunit YedZ [Gammaproteobacteria bacterium]|nr:sulfoxide reductase heme-binding subunit YedZ [Gammaproteobacteria bacterium]
MIRVLAHLVALLPFIYYLQGAFRQQLGADPQEVLLHGMGIWSLRFLLACLMVTPLRSFFRWPKLIHYRRMLGLYFAFYLALHILIYLWFFLGWEWSMIASELVKRPYLTVGIIAAILTVPLVVTSTNKARRWLKRRWNTLHKLIYPIGFLAVVHFYWQVKADINEPLIYVLIYTFLMVYRIWLKYSQKSSQKA